MLKKRNKGAILFIVLATIMVVFFLSAAMLSTVSNQARLTHHQVSRIQAYYAAKAGMVAAFECLRKGATDSLFCARDLAVDKTFCINDGSCDWNISDSDIPFPVRVTIGKNLVNGNVELKVNTNYTYTAP